MLPWMCGRQTLTIVVSSPCMTQAQMIVAVIAPRLATGGAISPLTRRAFAVSSARHHPLELFGIVARARINFAAQNAGVAGPADGRSKGARQGQRPPTG